MSQTPIELPAVDKHDSNNKHDSNDTRSETDSTSDSETDTRSQNKSTTASSYNNTSRRGSVALWDVEDDFIGKKSSPYHLLGACCFCSSLLVAIALVITVPLVDVENRTLGFIFAAFFGTFLAFLFLCLCCTYYLGASKESWVAPEFSGITKNFSNLIILVGLFVEFVQICSFSFNRTKEFSGADISGVNYIAVPTGGNSTAFDAIYWVFFVVAFTPYMFIILIRILIYVYTLKEGETEAASIVDRFQEKIHSVLWVLVNTLYFPVICSMLSGVDCTYRKKSITLDSNTHIECMEGKHIGILVCSLLALMVYYPAASFAQAQTQSISDIKFKPRIVFVMLQGKFVLALIAVFFTENYWVYYSGTFAINVIFLALNIIGQPCLVNWVNRIRTILFALSLWATICSGFVGTWILDNEHSSIPAILLLVGWVVLIVGLPLFFYFFSKSKEDEKTTDLA
mmetsp:Transcript_24937/g.34916  ORF Transcript_24937/g.34916 Transcript_24937/m.34916 type:complete len:455 (+) Transcript_24937:179-1543(+)